MKSVYLKALWNGFLFLISATGLKAQQDPQFSQYFLNQSMYNPAYCGVENVLSATAHFRSQWVGIEGHPLSQNISLHSPVPVLHGGLGVNLINEQAGAMRNTFFSASYSYIIKTRAGNLSIGLSGGGIQSNVDGTKLRAPDGNYDNGIIHNDDIIPDVSTSGFAGDFSAGLYFGGKNLSAGISATHLVPMDLKLNSNGGNLVFSFERHYYLQSAYLARLTKSVSMRPSVMLKSDGNRFQGEADLIFIYNDFLWLGAGYRGFTEETMDAIIGIAGIQINENFRLGYSYDYTTSALSSVNSGSHEVVLNYRVNLVRTVKPGKVIYTPRF